MTADQLIKHLKAIGLEPRPYSGRGMYSATCVGASTDDNPAAMTLPAGWYHDALGMGFIVYWPYIPWPSEGKASSQERLDANGKAIPDGMHEYAFDTKLVAVVRVLAHSKADAIEVMRQVIDGMDISEHWVAGFNSAAGSVKITEVTLSEDDGSEHEPFEIDGEGQ